MRFKQFLIEGGNLKIGELKADPISITTQNKSARTKDIHGALSALHDSFLKAHGEHLFGPDKKSLNTGTAYSGSTKHLMSSHIPTAEFVKHKPSTGDVDVQINKDHGDRLAAHLTKGTKFGKYTVAGVSKHGTEVSALMKHQNGATHQFDFEKVKYEHGEPTTGEQFLHSSSWEDTKAGIKGSHHKMLLNAAAGETHKLSITHGLRSRTDATDPGTTHPTEISKKMFGSSADHSKIHSFIGVTDLIKKHISKEQHQPIYDKFMSGAINKKSDNYKAASEHLKKHLGVKDKLSESAEQIHHTTVIPLVGFSPISHMGHAADLGGAMKKLPGTKHVGISAKADLFSPKERKNIMAKQWGQKDVTHHVVSGMGETLSKAHDSLPAGGKKVLHLLVGADRVGFAENIKKSVEAGKVKELGDRKFDEVHIHTPSDTGRSHGMSGTKMRTAAASGDIKTFSKHLGPSFDSSTTKHIMNRIKAGIDTGKLSVKR